jgi:beta-phosphoglucomutase-like phosphatase (HAD superfamily)
MTSRGIRQIIKGTRHLLLDFDGPVCSVFSGTPAPDVAGQLRDTLQAAGFHLPSYAQEETDPLEVFREAAKLSPDAAAVAHQLLTAFETRAITSARPTPGSADLIVTAYRTSRTVTIVSNNSGTAITAYLAAHQLTGYIRAVVARDDSDPDRMKPSPYRVREAVCLLDAGHSDCVLVGDSPSDVLAGHLAGITVIGYATTPARADALERVQAAAVTSDLAEITTALHASPAACNPTTDPRRMSAS